MLDMTLRVKNLTAAAQIQLWSCLRRFQARQSRLRRRALISGSRRAYTSPKALPCAKNSQSRVPRSLILRSAARPLLDLRESSRSQSIPAILPPTSHCSNPTSAFSWAAGPSLSADSCTSDFANFGSRSVDSSLKRSFCSMGIGPDNGCARCRSARRLRRLAAAAANHPRGAATGHAGNPRISPGRRGEPRLRRPSRRGRRVDGLGALVLWRLADGAESNAVAGRGGARLIGSNDCRPCPARPARHQRRSFGDVHHLAGPGRIRTALSLQVRQASHAKPEDRMDIPSGRQPQQSPAPAPSGVDEQEIARRARILNLPPAAIDALRREFQVQASCNTAQVGQEQGIRTGENRST
jgi:hypothetical protein